MVISPETQAFIFRRAKRHGLTVRDYMDLYDAQKGVCAICGHPEYIERGDRSKLLAIDHNHETGEVRGLLCGLCNSLIGMADESTRILQGAIDYLEAHK